ncbi:hypothetical protein CL647_06835 [bacterium]|nr:hypothetical protein [Actinomycetota bacterium]MBE33775.1 hypothetical protein [bacterium]|tara:strand:- start:9038 stop:9844 length:807 start_codon:yes stop_codon:yes gene_type:complete
MTNTFSQHSLFKKKTPIATKSDLIKNHINTHGDKIIVDIPLLQIITTPQVRRHFDNDKIIQLAEDIEQKGLIHPITIMKHPKEKETYILLIGGNRLNAAHYLNWETIPSIVKEYNDNTAQNEILQLAENMHRMNLNPIELSEAVIRIKEQTGYTLTKLAKVLGRNIDSIKQYSRINKLSESEKTYHIEQKSTKNDILAYLAKRELMTPKELNESLFDTITTNPYDHLSKNELTKKIHEAESFLKIAKKLLKQEKTNTPKNDDTNKSNK